MLRSPTSILNSIQKMKTNLRNDKQQLRIIKKNFVYLDQSNQIYPQNINQLKSKTRSKSLLHIDYLKEKAQQKQIKQSDKQNDNLQSNHTSRVSQVSKKTRNNNKLYIQDNAQNILKDITNFNKDSLSRKKIPNDNQNKTQKINIKSIKNRYQGQMQKIKINFENEKINLIETFLKEKEQQKKQFETKLDQMKEYIVLLEGQLDSQNLNQANNSQILKLDQQCQVTFSLEKSFKNQSASQYAQTQNIINLSYPIPQSQKTKQNPFQSHIQSQSSINSEPQVNCSIPKVNGLNLNHKNLVQQLCFKFFSQNNTDKESQHSQLSKQSLRNNERECYEHIINRLLNENTKLQMKLQKVYGSLHSEHSKDKTFFKGHGINYRTVSSHVDHDSNFNSLSNQESKVINKYFTSKSNNNMNIQENQAFSQYSSIINTEFNNYQSNRQSEQESKGKQSIVYRVSNVLSSQRLKDNRTSSRSKIPSKNPPVKIGSEHLANPPKSQHLRMKTQISEKCSNRNFSSYQSNSSGVNFESIPSSNGFSRQQKLNPINGNVKKDRSFKFYDDESIKSNKSAMIKDVPTHELGVWEEQSESEILNDEMKLKTIKTFKCFNKE